MPRVTIAQLHDRIQELKKERDSLKEVFRLEREEQEDIRKEFTKLIGPTEMNKEIGFPTESASSRRTREPMSWPEIFFTIGELNSDANYSILLAENSNKDLEIENLKMSLIDNQSQQH